MGDMDIYAEFENKDHELRPGLKAVMTIYLTPEGTAPAQAPTVGSRAATSTLVPK